MPAQTAINIAAFVTPVLCAVVFIWLIVSAYQERDVKMFLSSFILLVIASVFVVGYAAVLIGISVNTAVLFRPTATALLAVATWAAVEIHNTRALHRAAKEALAAVARMEQVREEIAVLVNDEQ